MKSKETFDKIRKKQIGWLSLRTRLTLFVGAEVVIVMLVALSVNTLLHRWFPAFANVPDLLVILVLGLVIALAVTRPLSRIFFDPVKKVREAMRTISDGDFNIRLETESTSVEIQELFAGFNMMAQALGNNEMLQSDFVSNVSHELKTPINAIEGNTTLLQNTELNEEQAELVDDILDDTKRLSGLIGNMLLLTKVDHQGIAAHHTTFSLDEQIRQCIIELERSWTKKETEFEVDLEEITYQGNEALLGHVWSNLIGNAIKFGPQNGLVRLKLHQNKQKIIFTVEDQGPGISEDAINRVFDRFYQADKSRKGEGNGLGLALAKQIVLMENGTISVQNRPEGGCIFTVELNNKN